MKYYPITKDDFACMYEQVRKGEMCTIPVRSEYSNAKGEMYPHPIMAWGHPSAYKFITRLGILYAVPTRGEYELA